MGNLFQMLQMFASKPNPQMFFEQFLQQNPGAMETIKNINNSTMGTDPKQVALQLAKQRGISEQQLMQMYNMLKR